MKTKPTHHLAGILETVAAISLAVLLPTSLYATDRYWDGDTDTTFSTPANWVGGVAPINQGSGGDVAYFTGGSYINQPTFNADTNLNGFVFGDGTNASAPVTMNGTGFFVLLNDGGIVMNPNAGAVTVNGFNFLRITANQTWTNNSSSAFTNNGNIISGQPPFTPTLTLTGTGVFNPGTLNQTTGTVNYAVSMTGNGTVAIGQSDSSGTITLNSGRLGIASSISLGASGLGNLVINGGTLQAQGADRTITNTNAIAINGSFTYGSAAEDGRILNTGAGAITLGANATISTYGNGTLQLAGAIGDGGSGRGITKADTGTLTLGAANTFTGATNITAGTLLISSSGSLASTVIHNNATLNVTGVSGGFTLASGQSLTGNGTVVGAVNVGNGTLAIGNSPGTMTFENNLTLTLGSTSNFEVNAWTSGSYDLALGGAGSQTVAFGGTLNVAFASGFNTIGSVKLFDFETYSSAFGPKNFTGLASGYSASFNDATGTLTVIPEPSTWVLLAVGLTVVVTLRRRKSNC